MPNSIKFCNFCSKLSFPNLIKIAPDGFYVLGANRYDGYGTVTFFEKHPWSKPRTKKHLNQLLDRGISFVPGRTADPSSVRQILLKKAGVVPSRAVIELSGVKDSTPIISPPEKLVKPEPRFVKKETAKDVSNKNIEKRLNEIDEKRSEVKSRILQIATAPKKTIDGTALTKEQISDFFQKQIAKRPELLAPEDMGKWEDPNFYVRLVGNAIPTIAGAIVAGAITGPIGGVAFTVGVEGGFAYQEAINAGASADQAKIIATKVGAINGSLEYLPIGRVLNKVKGGRQLKGNILRRIIKEIVAQGGTEASTEAMQEIVNNAVLMEIDENRELFDNVLEAAVGGGLVGILMGGGGQIISKQQPISQPTQPQIQPMQEPTIMLDELDFAGVEPQKAKEIYADIKDLPINEQRNKIKELIDQGVIDKTIFKKMKAIRAGEKLEGLDYDIKTLPIKQKAQYIWDKLQEFNGDENAEKEYLKELKEKGILSKNTMKELKKIRFEERGY